MDGNQLSPPWRTMGAGKQGVRMAVLNGNIDKKDHDQSRELQRRWWIRVRRSFSIPDLVTDEHALEMIVGSVAPKSLRSELKKPISEAHHCGLTWSRCGG